MKIKRYINITFNFYCMNPFLRVLFLLLLKHNLSYLEKSHDEQYKNQQIKKLFNFLSTVKQLKTVLCRSNKKPLLERFQ